MAFILIAIKVSAQIQDVDNFRYLDRDFSSLNMETGATFNTFLSSNSVNSKFVSSLYGKKFIDNEMKASNKLKSNNVIGNQDHGNVYFCHMPEKFLGTDHAGYRIGLVYHNHRDMRFTDDIFKLIFYGNKMFAGKTADLSDFQLNLLTYQEFQMGYFKQSTLNENPFTYYIGLSFIKGQDYNSLRFNEASLYTEETGEYIDLNLSMTYQAMDTVKAELTEFNGIGGAANFYFSYRNEEKKYSWQLTINNVGFIRWNDRALTIPLDTSLHYEGFEIENILDYSDSTFFDIDPDSIVTDFFGHTDTSDYYKVLPERIHFAFSKEFMNGQLIATIGAGYYYNANNRMPLMYLQGNYFIREHFSVSMLSGYGGYGSFHLGMAAEYVLKDRYIFSIASSNVLGFILPAHSFSQNIFGSLAFRF